MKLTYLQMKHFKNFKNTEIEFTNGMNFIVGKNGSGKTNVMRAIKFCIDCLFFVEYNPKHYKKELEITLNISFSKQEKELFAKCLKTVLVADALSDSSDFMQIPLKVVRETILRFKPQKFQRLINKLRSTPEFELIIKNTLTPFEIGRIGSFDEIDTELQHTIRMKIINVITISNLDVFFEIVEKFIHKKLKISLLKKLLAQKKWYIDTILNDLKIEDLCKIFSTVVLKTKYEHSRFETKCSIVLDSKVDDKPQMSFRTGRIGKNRNSYKMTQIVEQFLSSETETLQEFIMEGFQEKSNGVNFSSSQNTSFSELIALNEDIKANAFKIETKLDWNRYSIINPYYAFQQVITSKLYLIPEHRGLFDEYSKQLQIFTVKNIAEILYNWKNSPDHNLRKKFLTIKIEFYEIFEMNFDVYGTINKNTRLATKNNKQKFFSKQEGLTYEKTPQSVELKDDEEAVEITGPSLQFVENGIEMDAQDAPSGAYEILLSVIMLNAKGGKTLLFDEPGRGLHPQMQRNISKIISERKAKKDNDDFISIVITHSPYFFQNLLGAGLPIWKCIDNEIIKIPNTLYKKEKTNKTSIPNQPRYSGYPKTITSILFANKIIFVEGITDFQFFSELFQQFSEFNINELEVDILSTEGKDSLFFATNLAEMVKNKYVVICDLDVFFPKPNKRNQNENNNAKIEVKQNYCDLCKEKIEVKQSSKLKIPKFSDSRMVNNLKLLSCESFKEKFSEYKNMSYDEIRHENNKEKLSNFRKAIRDLGFFCWKEGELEDFLKTTSEGGEIGTKASYDQILEYIKQKKAKGNILGGKAFKELSEHLKQFLKLS